MSRKKDSGSSFWMELYIRYEKYILGAIVIGFVAFYLINNYTSWLDDDEETEEFVLEETTSEIESVLPKGEIVVCSAVIEDYVTKTNKEKTLGVIESKHTCVQILKMKCCYKVDLDKIEYQLVDSAKTIKVKMPKIEYEATLQDSPFISDDEAYWKEALPSTNKMKEKVAKKIEKRFCTPENKKKGELYAEEAVTKIMNSLGYEVEFVRSLRKKAN